MNSHFTNLPLRFATALCLLLLAAAHPTFGAVTFTGDTSNSTNVVVGNTGQGNLTIDDGSSLSNTEGYLGFSTGSNGTVIVNGGNWTNSSALYIGSSGTGSLTISSGNISNTNGIVGNSVGSNGTVNMSGGNWTNSAILYIGRSGTGSLTITNGTISNTYGTVGDDAGSNGTVSVSGGNWTNNDLFIGNRGTGSLTISGGIVTTTSGTLGREGTGSNGTVNVSGGTWVNSGSLSVGRSGTGSLTISSGTVSNTSSEVGFRQFSFIPSGTGTVNVSGGAWTNSGSLSVGKGGNGSLTISGGIVTNTDGEVGSSEGPSFLIARGTGTVNVSGGAWTNSGNLSVGKGGNGSLTISGGTVTNTNGYIGLNASSNGTVNVSGGTWSSSSNLAVGVSGTGSLTINGTGTVIVGDTLSRGSNGTINLENGGTLQIGTGGATGTLATDLTNNGTLIFDRSSDSTCSFEISGTGSLTKNGSGTLTLSGNNTYSGGTTVDSGTLATSGVDVISDSSAVIVESGATFSLGGAETVGAIAGAGDFSLNAYTLTAGGDNSSTSVSGAITGTGSFVKTGAGTLILSGNNSYSGGTTVSSGTLAVSSTGQISHSGSDFYTGFGSGDNATLTINGGSLSNGRGFIGYGNGSTGTVNINSGTWTNALNLRVGYYGNGTLNLAGGSISNVNGLIGKYGASTGVANVIGGTWTSSGYMTIGDEATGTLNLTGGNVVVASGSGNVTIGQETGSSGTLNIGTGTTVGTLQAARVTGGNGTAVVNFNHSGNETFSPILAGSLAVNKLGSGTTTLSGNNTYTGATAINAGELLVNGNLASSTTTVNSGGTLGGIGTLGAVTINSGGTIAPGNSPGTLTVGNITWNGGGFYNWELGNANGTTGMDWDLISSSGTLTIGANATNKFTIRLASYGSGSLSGVKSASWEIGNFTTGITGFSNDYFTFNATGMSGSAGSYSLSLGGGNTTLLLNYASAGSVWSTGSGNWTTATQWQGNTLPINGDAIEFSGPGGTSTNNFASGNLSEISGVTFTSTANGSYMINGNALTIGADGIVNNSNSTQTVAINLTLGTNQTFASYTANLVVSGNISGTGNLTKSGNQTLTLAGANTYNGGTTLSAGTLSIGNGGTTGSISGNITNNAALVFNRSDSSTYSGSITGTGTLEKLGFGTITLSGSNSYTGGTTINSGTLLLESTGQISHSGAAFYLAGAGENAAVILNGGSILNFDGYIGFGNGSAGTVNMNSGNWTNGENLRVGYYGNGTLNLTGGSISNVNGVIGRYGASNGVANVSGGTWSSSGNFRIGQEATGTLNLTGGNVVVASGSGNVTIGVDTGSSGTLNIGTGSTVGTLQAARVTGGNGTAVVNFNHSGNQTFSPILAGSLAVNKLGSGTTTLTGNNTYTGGTIVSAGTLAGTTSSLQGAISNNAVVNFDQASNGTYAGAMGGSGSVVKTGAGTLTLSGINTYSGGTTISAGTLGLQGQIGAVTNNASFVVQTGGVSGAVSNLVGATATNNGTVALLANEGTFTNSGNITGSVTSNGTLSSNGWIGGTLSVGAGTAIIGAGGMVVGNTMVEAGSLVVEGSVGSVTNSASFVVQTGGVSGAVANLATASNNGTVGSLANAGNFTNRGNITGDVFSINGLVKIGQSGRVSGNTTIGGGELVVDGAVANVSNNDLLTIEQSGTAGDVTNLDDGFGTNNGTVASVLNSGAFANSGNITGSVMTFGSLDSTGNIGGSLIVGGGVTTINGTVAGATTVTAGLTAGVLQGTGTLGELEILSGGTVAPGTLETVGTLHAGNFTLNGGGIYNWQTLSLNGTGTPGSAWDLISSNGSLILNASANSTVGIRVTSLNGNFTNDITKAKWVIGSFQGDIIGYGKSYFSVNSTGTGARGRFFVTTEEKSLMLNYKTAAVWLGGTGNWTTGSLWEDGYIAQNGDEVEFSGNGGTSTNNNLMAVASLVFTSSANGYYLVDGGDLTIGSGGIVNDSAFEHTIALNLAGGGNLSVNTAASNLTVSGVISGNSALSKMGNKTLTLSGNNTYSGGTTVSAGTLAGTTQALKGSIVNNAAVNFNQSFNGTYAGVMSGTGSLTKSGNGVVVLSGNNTYSGGTTINSGVLAAAAVSANNVVTLNPNAFGTGSVNINSGGAMLVPSTTLGGSRLALGGDLTLNNGTIAFYDIGTSPAGQDLRIDVAGNFTNAGNGVVFDFSQVEALDSGNYTLVSYNGTNFATSAISSRAGVGTTLQGSFSMNGSSLVYTVLGAQSSGTDIQNNGGPNTPIVSNYTINQTGVVTIGLNNTVSALTFNSGGTLNIQSNGVLNITSGTLNVQNGSSVVGGGTLVAPAGLNKDGTGELDFTNNVVVTGTASVNAGLLSVNGQLQATGGVVVNPNATLGGAGIVFANVDVKGGNLSPGNSPGTLAVVGNLVLTGANSTIIEIESPTNYDRIVVSGEAALGGTLNAVAYGGGTITPGARYEFLQAGSITGEFSSLIAPEGLRVRFLNSGTIGTLLFGPESFVPMALNPNQTSVAKALDSFILATSGDELAVSIALDSLTTEQFPSAFDQIMPGFYESLADMVIEQTYNQAQLLTQRMGSLRLGAQGFQAMGISQPIKYDKDGTSAADAKTASPIVESAMATNWNSWVMANGEFSISRGLSGVPNYNNNAGGFLVGADYRLSENFSAGVFAGYEYSYAKYDGGSSTRGNSALFGLYGSYTNENGYYADAVVSGGYTGFQTRRSIEFSTIDRTARANPNSGQFSAALNLGKDFEIGKFTLGPIVGAQYTYAGIGGFTETGADSLNLALGQQNANSLRSNLGARLAYNWEVGSNITLIPEVRGFWMHEFLNNSRNISSALDGGNGPSFDYETEAPYRNSVFGGAGISAKVGDRWNASVFYNVNFGSENYTNNIISTSLGFSF